MLGFFIAVASFGRGALSYDASRLWLIALGGALFAIGLTDDLVDLKPRSKFLLQLAVILVLVGWGPHFDVPIGALNIALSIFWLASTTNAFNLIDGVDGLAAGIGALSALAIAAIAIPLHHATAVWALALSGALLGFLFYNFNPASIFMGDAGALSVGIILGVLSIQGGHSAYRPWYEKLMIALLIMFVPLLDTFTVTVTRIATGRTVSRRGLDHCHHRLASLGLSDRAIMATLCSVQMLASASAVGLAYAPTYAVVLAVPYLVLIFGTICLFLADRTFVLTAPGQMQEIPRLARIALRFGYKRRVVEAALDLVLVCAAYFGAFALQLSLAPSSMQMFALARSAPIIVGISSTVFVLTGTYRSIWRYAGVEDALRFAVAALLATLSITIASQFLPVMLSPPMAVLFGILLFNLLTATRLSFRVLREILRRISGAARYRVIVVGTDRRAEAAARHLVSENAEEIRMVGFLDDDEFKWRKLIRGYPVLGAVARLEEIYNLTPFDAILVAQEQLNPAHQELIRMFALNYALGLAEYSAGLIQFEVRDGRDLNPQDMVGRLLKSRDSTAPSAHHLWRLSRSKPRLGSMN
jgi:UDP-GlcNAc:undecaprenyl-phosphate GlcNAc-1-phosphate transferase